MRHRHSVTEDPAKVVGIAALAAFIGATVAMLFAPRSGQQVRQGLKRRAVSAKDAMQEHLVPTVNEAEGLKDNTNERLQSTASKAVKDAKSTVEKAAKDAKETTQRAKATTKSAAKSEDASE